MASLAQFVGLSRGRLVDGLSGGSVGNLFEHTIPGFGLLQSSLAQWANLDIATIAAAVAVFGAVATGIRQLRRIASSIHLWATRLCTASVSIPGHDRLNREVLNWMGAHVLIQRGTRVLTASSRPVVNEAMRYGELAQVRSTDPKEQKLIPVQYLPTFGTTWFLHERNVFIVRRTNFDGGWPNEYAVAPQGDEPLVVMCLGRSVTPIKNFLQTCRQYAASQRETFVTVRSSGTSRYTEDWDTAILKPVRPLETVHMDPATKDELVADIETYLQPLTRQFYSSRGIPYRRGYLLHGK
jgi:chaperone BCS1